MKTRFFEEFTKVTDGAYPMLKLNGASYSKKDAVLTVRFIISAFDAKNFDDTKKQEVQKAVEGLFPGIGVSIQYVRTYADETVVKNKVHEYFNSVNQMIFRSLNDSNVAVVVDSDTIKVKVTLETPLYKMFLELSDGLCDYLDRSFNNEIVVNAVETVINLDDEQPIIMSTSAAKSMSARLINVKIGGKVYAKGKISGISQMPGFIVDVKDEADNVILCGDVSNFQSRKYRNKKYNPEDPKSGPEELPLMRFSINDTTAMTEVAIFPRPEEAAAIENMLSKECQVICQGRVSKYNDNLSYTASAVFLCEIDKNSICTFTCKPTPAEYRKIFPSKYQGSFEQRSLLVSESVEKSVNSYFLGKTFVFFDLECTDKVLATAKIIQIAALKVVDGIPTETFETFVNPHEEISEFIENLTHISNAHVANAPDIKDVVPDFFKFTRDSILVGHNIIGYDIPILNRVAEEFGYKFENELVDTLALARKYLPELKNHKLQTLSEHFDINHENAHRADSDVEADFGVLKELAKRM